MIDPKSLRIGNWVIEEFNPEGEHHSNSFVQVEFNTLGTMLSTSSDPTFIYYPIPLSATVLEKIQGIKISRKESKYFDFYQIDELVLRYCKVSFTEGWVEGKWYISWDNSGIMELHDSSLHWLQNYYYFAISGGRELDIKL